MAAIILFALLAAGLVSLRHGWRGHRTGITPYCRDCGYNLTALQSSECPECGQIITDDAIMLGELHRHPKQIATGMFFLALAVLFIVAGARQWLPGINWYSYKPTFWVVADTRSSDVRQATKAYRELQSRLKDNTLSDSQCHRAAEAALAELMSPTPRPGLSQIHADLLDALRRAAKLTDDQHKRFFENAATFTLQARPQPLARCGVPICFRSFTQLGSQTSLWSEVATQTASLTPAPSPQGYSCWGRSTGGGPSTQSGLVKVPGPGTHEIFQRVRVRIYDGSNLDPEKSVLLHETEKVLSTKATALAEEPPNYIKVVTAPDLEQAVRASLQLQKLSYGTYDPRSLELLLKVNGPPISLAFSIAVMAGDRKVASGSLEITRGNVTNYSTGFECKVPDLTEVDVILTPDVERAKRTVDITEIWGKPIRFDKVQVVGSASSQPGK